MDDLYRGEILEHYEHPHHHGALVDADISIGDNNPSCGDRTSVDVKLTPDRTRIADIAFSGDGCVISQAATSMLMEMAKGRTASEVATLPKDELLEEIGVPLQNNPTRLKCALLGLTTLKVALHKAKGTPLPEGLSGFDELELK